MHTFYTVGAKCIILQLDYCKKQISASQWRNYKHDNQNKVINKTIKSHFKQNDIRNKNKTDTCY